MAAKVFKGSVTIVIGIFAGVRKTILAAQLADKAPITSDEAYSTLPLNSILQVGRERRDTRVSRVSSAYVEASDVLVLFESRKS